MRTDCVILAQPILNLTRDRLQVRLGSAGADYEKIGKTGDLPQVDRDDFDGLLVRGKLCAEGG
jgi:hypothetical protein